MSSGVEDIDLETARGRQSPEARAASRPAGSSMQGTATAYQQKLSGSLPCHGQPELVQWTENPVVSNGSSLSFVLLAFTPKL